MPELGRTAIVSLAVLASACQPSTRAGPRPAAVTVEAPEDWRSSALPQHAAIVEDMPPLFRRLAAAARARSDRELLDPDLLLDHAAPAPGAYRCRHLRLPAPARSREGRQAFCFVGAEDGRLSLTLETPARRLGGYLWTTRDARRLVFLGGEFAPPARAARPYGDPPSASTAGLFERIGDFRYRLIVRGPSPGTVDVYELIAAP